MDINDILFNARLLHRKVSADVGNAIVKLSLSGAYEIQRSIIKQNTDDPVVGWKLGLNRACN